MLRWCVVNKKMVVEEASREIHCWCEISAIAEVVSSKEIMIDGDSKQTVTT